MMDGFVVIASSHSLFDFPVWVWRLIGGAIGLAIWVAISLLYDRIRETHELVQVIDENLRSWMEAAAHEAEIEEELQRRGGS